MKTETSEKGLERPIVAEMAAAGWIPGDRLGAEED